MQLPWEAKKGRGGSFVKRSKQTAQQLRPRPEVGNRRKGGRKELGLHKKNLGRPKSRHLQNGVLGFGKRIEKKRPLPITGKAGQEEAATHGKRGASWIRGMGGFSLDAMVDNRKAEEGGDEARKKEKES